MHVVCCATLTSKMFWKRFHVFFASSVPCAKNVFASSVCAEFPGITRSCAYREVVKLSSYLLLFFWFWEISFKTWFSPRTSFFNKLKLNWSCSEEILWLQWEVWSRVHTGKACVWKKRILLGPMRWEGKMRKENGRLERITRQIWGGLRVILVGRRAEEGENGMWAAARAIRKSE